MYEFMETIENLTKDELYDYYTAGRVVVLPAVPDTTVYRIVETDNGEYQIETYRFSKVEMVENLELFGEIYFSEYEEAEKAKQELERN